MCFKILESRTNICARSCCFNDVTFNQKYHKSRIHNFRIAKPILLNLLSGLHMCIRSRQIRLSMIRNLFEKPKIRRKVLNREGSL